MKEALRGTLLSVLFFALLMGGAPGMVAAEGDCVVSGECNDDTTPVPSNGGMTESQRLEWCAANTRAGRVGGVFLAAGTLVSTFAPPIGFGMILFGTIVEIGAAYDLIKYDCP